MTEPTRWWTVGEANGALPWVTERMETARKLIEDARNRAARAGELVRSNGHGAMPADIEPIRTILDELHDQGIVVRDVDQGLIDFPARAGDGRTYLLCWLVGEPEVAWWHWPEAGFAGRTPLSEPPG